MSLKASRSDMSGFTIFQRRPVVLFLKAVADAGEQAVDLAAQEPESEKRRDGDERDDQCVLDERLTLFPRQFEPGPNVRKKHVRSPLSRPVARPASLRVN